MAATLEEIVDGLIEFRDMVYAQMDILEAKIDAEKAIYYKCASCNGNGQIGGDPTSCTDCGGTGFRPKGKISKVEE